jgi:hypothetical protein
VRRRGLAAGGRFAVIFVCVLGRHAFTGSDFCWLVSRSRRLQADGIIRNEAKASNVFKHTRLSFGKILVHVSKWKPFATPAA